MEQKDLPAVQTTINRAFVAFLATSYAANHPKVAARPFVCATLVMTSGVALATAVFCYGKRKAIEITLKKRY